MWSDYSVLVRLLYHMMRNLVGYLISFPIQSSAVLLNIHRFPFGITTYLPIPIFSLLNILQKFPSIPRRLQNIRKMTDSASSCGLMSLNCNKAGMAGLDKEKINQIIESASKGSKFYKKKQEDQARIDGQVAELKLSLSRLRPDLIQNARKEADM